MVSSILTLKRAIALLALLATAISSHAATVTWDGGGGDFSWQNRTNWSSDTLPGIADDVVINLSGIVTITSSSNVTILSLQSSNNFALTAGKFRVTTGSSIVQGSFSTTNTPTLSVVSNGTSLTLAGNVFPGNANLEASGGATLSLPTLTSYAKPTGCATVFWQASGAGSVLDLPGITNLSSSICASLNVHALNGAQVSLPSLTTVTEGTINFYADGTNSLIDLTALQQSLATQRAITFETRNGGQIGMPAFPGSIMSVVMIKSGGVLPVAQLRQLRGFTVSGMSLDFPALTHLGVGDITVEGGAVVSVPLLSNHVARPSCSTGTWSVNGTASRLNFPALTNLTGGDCGWLEIEARSGGILLLTNVSTVTDGTLLFEATGTNSLVDLRNLERSPSTGNTVTFTARTGGTVWIPELRGATNVIVSLQTGGALPVAQLGALRGFEVVGMTVNFPALTNLGLGNITVSGGGIATAPMLVTHRQDYGCPANTWLATGTGSVLDLSSLTNLIGAECGYLIVRAVAGGTVVMDNLPIITEGTLNFLAEGAGSVINLQALRDSLGTRRNVSFDARNNGAIAIPLMKGGETVNVTIRSGGALDATQMNLLRSLTVSGTSLALPGLTNLFSGDLIVEQGAVLSFPNLFSHDQGNDCVVNNWSVSGTNSVLDLSTVTNLVGSRCGSLGINALAGGRIILSNLTSIADGRLDFLADGTNSVLDLRALEESRGTDRTVSFEARKRGEIVMPEMRGGASVTVALHSNGVMPVEQMERLAGISAGAQTVEFSALTNFDGGSFTITNGAVVTAPNLATCRYDLLCPTDTWLVRDTGSVLNLPALTRLTGASCGWLDMQALNGGHLLLGSVTNIPAGTIYMLSSGSGSVIDLHSVANFLNRSPSSRLVATNGGTILLNENGVVFSGVSLNLAPGTPNLPATLLGATNTILHGRAWHSYWIERRDAASSATEWEFYQRVPLTNDFQIIDPLAAAGSEFRVWEFTAEPFALELTAKPDSSVGVVLYGPPGAAVDIQAADNLTTPVLWQSRYTVAMTNSFRILPTEPAGTPQRYFRVLPQLGQ